MKRILWIAFFIIAIINVKAQDVPQSERDALIAFYDALDGDYWARNTNWKSTEPVSTWYGIKVSEITPDNFHVTEITLNYNGLIGQVPIEIKYLPYLKTLQLNENKISNIPEEIGFLENLELLSVTGSGYARIYPLKTLPSGIGLLSKLKHLNFEYNSITQIPSSFENLRNLESIYLGVNQITEFPKFILVNKNLTSLDLSSNINMIGELGDDFATLINIEYLQLGNTKISVKDNPDFFLQMSKLSSLSIGDIKIGKVLNLSKNIKLENVSSRNEDLEVVLLNNNQNKILTTVNLGEYNGKSNLKCVSVDEPIKATAGQSSYRNWHVNFKDDLKNFQSDCSSYLSIEKFKPNKFNIKIENPIKDHLNIFTNEKIHKIEIYTISGQLVKSFNNKSQNVSDLHKGIYLLKIKTEKETTTIKMIKQ